MYQATTYDHTCKVCGAEFQSPRAQREYCSGRCRTALYRVNKAKAAADKAPARAAMLAKLARIAPKTAKRADELVSEAGQDCTELVFKLIGQAVEELCDKRKKTAGPV